MILFTKDFWNMAFERAVKTIAQATVSAITVSSFYPGDVDQWLQVAGIAGMSGLISVLTSLSSYDAVKKAITAPIEADVKLAVEVGQRQGPTLEDIKKNG